MIIRGKRLPRCEDEDYRINSRMEDGSYRIVTLRDDPSLRPGDAVVVDNRRVYRR